MSQPSSDTASDSEHQPLHQRLPDIGRGLDELSDRSLSDHDSVAGECGTEEICSESLERFANRAVRLGGWLYRIDEEQVYGSGEAYRIVGLPGDAAPRVRDLLRLFHRSWRHSLLKSVLNCLQHGTAFQIEGEVASNRDEGLWCLIIGEAVSDANGRIIAIRGAIQDVSERRQQDLTLRCISRAREMLSHCNEALLKASSEEDLMCDITRLIVTEGEYRHAVVAFGNSGGQAVSSLRGMSTMAGNTIWKLSWDQQELANVGPLSVCLETGQPVVCANIEAEYPQLGSLERLKAEGVVGCVCMPLLHQDRVEGLLAFYTDEVRDFSADELRLLRELTANVRFGLFHLSAQAQKEASQKVLLDVAAGVTASVGPEFFQQLTSHIASALQADGCFIGRIDYSEGVAMARCFAGVLDGQPADELSYRLAGTPCQELLRLEELAVPHDARVLYPKDHHLWDLKVEAYVGRRLMDSQGNPVGILFVLFRKPIDDAFTVTSTLRIFAARAASELERLDVFSQLREQASLLDRASDAIVVRDLQHRIQYWNRGAERLYGWLREEAEGQRVDRLCYQDDGQYCEAMNTLLERGEWQGNLEQRHKDGHRLVVSAHWSLVTNDAGQPKAIMAINTDITRRLVLEEQLHRSQRLESVGQFTGGVAHDFNNLLTVILGNAELLEESLEESPGLLGLASMVRSAAERGSELTQRLLAFARRQTLAPKAFDVNGLLMDMDGLLRRAMPAYIDIEIQSSAGLWPAMADPVQLESAVLNLAINARDAMRQGGTLGIETANVTLRAGELGADFPDSPGEYVLIALTDNGCGMKADVAAKAFDPFFTTKEKGKGTGLGLSMVYGFIKQSGGHVDLISTPGQGTTIKLYLPRADDIEEVVRATGETAKPARGAGHILVVEDDDLVRRYAEEQLTLLGYRVTSVRNGREALRILDGDTAVDLLFTDVVMPGMNGRELARQALERRPTLKVLYTSGYTENAMAEHGRLDEGIQLLSKPYRGSELAARVSEVLGGRVSRDSVPH